MKDEIFYWDSFLNQEEYLILSKQLQSSNWKFGAREPDGNDLRSFWYMELINSKIENIFKNKRSEEHTSELQSH